MPKRENRDKPHEFTAATDFDQAMRKIARTPKKDVEQAAQAAKKQQRERKRKPGK